MLQENFKRISKMSKGCFKDVSRLFQMFYRSSMVFKESLMDVLRKCQGLYGCIKGISKKFKVCFDDASQNFQARFGGCFNEVSSELARASALQSIAVQAVNWQRH